jgi:hypothetical protein
MAGQVAWRFSPEHRSPSRPQRFDIETAQARDLVFQRYFGCFARNRSCSSHRITPHGSY